MAAKKETETKAQGWVKILIGTGGVGAIIVALIALFSRGGGHNITTGNNSGNVAIGDHATVQTFISTSETNHPIPNLPQIKIETLDGLPVGTSNNPHFRLHRLVVRNFNSMAIDNFCSRLQLPEPIVAGTETNQTTGTVIGWRPLLGGLRVKGTGGRTAGGLWVGPTSTVIPSYPEECFIPSATYGRYEGFSGAGEVTGVWELTVARLPPHGQVSITFLTSSDTNATNYIRFASLPLSELPPKSKPDPKELHFFFEGKYQFQTGVKVAEQLFFVPITFDAAQRTFSSLAIQRDAGHWRPVVLNLF